VGKILVATTSAELVSERVDPSQGSTLESSTYETNEASSSGGLIPQSAAATAEGSTLRKSDPTIGSGKITEGELGIVITNNQVTDNSRIFIQATSPTAGQTLIVTTKIAGAGFTVEIEAPLTKDITFDWWVVN
jgi:hypothetical protein